MLNSLIKMMELKTTNLTVNPKNLIDWFFVSLLVSLVFGWFAVVFLVFLIGCLVCLV